MVHWTIDKWLRAAVIIILLTAGLVGALAVYNIIFNILPVPRNAEEYLKDPIISWIVAMLALLASAYGLRSSRDFLIHHLPWKKQIDEKINNIARGIKPDIYYSASYAEKMKDKKSNSKPAKSSNKITLSWGLLVAGIIILAIGAYLYSNSTENDRPAFQTWEGIHLFKSKSLNYTNVDLNFLLQDSSSSIHIYYTLQAITNNTFIGIELPYEGTLTERNNDWVTLPRSGNSTVIYKIFLCKENMSSCNYHVPNEDDGNDQFNLLFKINDLIDAKQFYTHSLNIPFGGSVNHDVMGLFQFDIAGGETYSWNTDTSDIDFRITVSVQDDATEINLIPNAHPRAYSFEPTEVNRTIYSWDVPLQDTSFHIDYVVPDEREHYETLNTLGIVLFGSGISIIAVFFGEIGRQKIQSQ